MRTSLLVLLIFGILFYTLWKNGLFKKKSQPKRAFMAKRKPYKVNALFQPGPITFLNACVGQNGGPYEFNAYSLGYFEAAESIVETSRRGALTVDLVIYPITYCYRHAIELALKYLIDKVPSIWDEKATFPTTHRLTDAWKVLVPFLQRDQIFDNGGNTALIDGVISDMSNSTQMRKYSDFLRTRVDIFIYKVLHT